MKEKNIILYSTTVQVKRSPVDQLGPDDTRATAAFQGLCTAQGTMHKFTYIYYSHRFFLEIYNFIRIYRRYLYRNQKLIALCTCYYTWLHAYIIL